MIEAYRLLADAVDHPLHLGVTEAGPPPGGLFKATAGIATLLAEGIGDTIRYSLTADPVEEARAGRQLLEIMGLRERKNIDLIACPRCGRAEIDVIAVAKEAMEAFGDREIPLQVAVMGCVVNGPGEARDADLGIAAGNKRGHLFVKGRNVAVVPEDEMVVDPGRVGRAHPRARGRGRDGPGRCRQGHPRGREGPGRAARRAGRRRQRQRAARRAHPQALGRIGGPRSSRLGPTIAPTMAKQPIVTPQIRGLPRWYQDVVAKAELADNGPVRGTMVIRPYGYSLWERMQAEVDLRIKAAGADNLVLPAVHPRRAT